MALRWPNALTEPFKNREPGVWISAGAHAAVLGLALFAVAAPALPDAQEGVPVEVLTEQQFSELTRGERNAERPEKTPNRADRVAEKQEQREPENAKTDAPAAPTRTADTKIAAVDAMPLRANEADPVKEEAEAAAAKAEAMADARAKADAEAKARQQAELANKFSPGDIRETLARSPSQSTGATGREVQRTASLGTATGNAQRLSPSLRDALVGMLQQQIERCYSAPPGATQGVVLPMLDIRLNADGSLTSEPRVMRSGSNAVDQSIAQAALRAVRRCAPYKIPAQYAPYYNDWKAINAEFEFSPV